jgi:formylglycine-generating enzyme required for sulfatase activity
MKPWRILLSVSAASIGLASSASAVTFEWVTVGDPGNACDQQSFDCYGAVGYTFRIATREVTNGQYAEFLNAKAPSDPLGLYNPNMTVGNGGIARSGIDGGYTYSATPGRENWPVNRVSYFDALRFANWMHNGQGDGDTETGAYTLVGGTPTPSNPLVQRNPDATVFLATDEEWYKAAFYDTDAGLFYDFPTRTDTLITCSAPTTTPNTANCGGVVGTFTDVESYPASSSPNGTFDQGGNALEWTDGDVGVLENRTIRGGFYNNPAEDLGANDVNNQDYDDPWHESAFVGFRLASVAEGVICGDAICEGDEVASCPADCPDVCGDGLCTGSEDLQNCPDDCACTTNADCDDGFFCNGVESCSGGACEAGEAVDCDDGVGCTVDTCDEAADACDHEPQDIVCEDLSFCNGDEWCDPQFGCQAGTRIVCEDDGIDCTDNFCSEAIDGCMTMVNQANCPDDGLFCNGDEFCGTDLGCAHEGNPCDAGETCNESTDTCDGGCQSRWEPCSRNSDCCSNRCLRFWGLCR